MAQVLQLLDLSNSRLDNTIHCLCMYMYLVAGIHTTAVLCFVKTRYRKKLLIVFISTFHSFELNTRRYNSYPHAVVYTVVSMYVMLTLSLDGVISGEYLAIQPLNNSTLITC